MLTSSSLPPSIHTLIFEPRHRAGFPAQAFDAHELALQLPIPRDGADHDREPNFILGPR